MGLYMCVDSLMQSKTLYEFGEALVLIIDMIEL
jgi:hypothetical protein